MSSTRHRRALRPAEHGPQRRHRSLLAWWRAVRSLALTGRETAVDLCTRHLPTWSSPCPKPGRAARVVGSLPRRPCSGTVGPRSRSRGAPAARRPARGDAMRLPLAGASAGRPGPSPSDPQRASHARGFVADCLRVLKPGGRLAILEIPDAAGARASGRLYAWYFTRLPPRTAHSVSAPHRRLHPPAGLRGRLGHRGVLRLPTARRPASAEVRADPATFGAVYLYTAIRPDRGARG